MRPLIIITLLVLVFVLPAGLAVAGAFGPVSRRRLEKFAFRQQLPITAANGDVVIRYLATTRRWRTVGLVTGLLASVAYSLPDELYVNFGTLFAGWFVGAVIAEWRVATIPAGERRAAVLAPRRRRDYLGTPARVVTDGVAAATLTLGVAALARSALTPLAAPAAALLLGAVVAVSVVALVQRQVLTRPQPAAEPDLVAADDAIRGRSLHVLAGSTIALLSFLAGPLLVLATDGPPAAAAVGHALSLIGPVTGWLVATRGSTVARPRRPAGAVSEASR